MANSKILQLILRVTGGKQASQEFKSLNGSLGQFAGIAGNLLGGAVLYKLADGVAQFGAESVRTAVKAERLGIATENLAHGLGLTADALVDGVQRASGGTIDKLTALESANKAMMFGVIDSQAEMSKLAEVATVLGAAMGQDAATSLNDLTTALGRQSPLILDNLGLLTDVEGWQRQYADSIGKAVSQLTEEEKKQAFVNGALGEASRKADELGGIAPTAASGLDRLSAAWANLKMTVGKSSTGPLAEGADWLAGVVESLDKTIDPTRLEEVIGLLAQLRDEQQRSVDYATNPEIKKLVDKRIEALEREKTALSGIVAVYRNELGPAQRAQLEAEAGSLALLEAQEIQIVRNADAKRYSAMAESYGVEIQHIGRGAQQTRIDDYFSTLKEGFSRGVDDLTATLRSTVEGEVQPTLDEVWQAPGDTARIDENARRLADVAVNGFASPWLETLNTQFQGFDFWQPMADAIESGDSTALQNAATSVLTGDDLTKLWDKDLIIERVKQSLAEQNMREELVNTIMAELSAEGVQVDAGQVSAAMGGGDTLAQPLADNFKTTLPAAMGGTGAILISAIGVQVKENETEMIKLAEIFADRFDEYLPDALSEAGGTFLEAISISVAERLGLAVE